MMPNPSPNGCSARDHAGKFLPGNPGGPGNPHAGRVSKLRAALVNAVSEEDIRAVAAAIVTAAKAGDIPAAKLLFDRVLGKPVADDHDQQNDGRNRILSMLHKPEETTNARA